MVGTLSLIALALSVKELENDGQPCGQSTLGSNKDTIAQGSFPGWQCSVCIGTHHLGGVNTAHDSTGRGQLETQPMEPFWILLYAPLPLADFNLYSLAYNKL